MTTSTIEKQWNEICILEDTAKVTPRTTWDNFLQQSDQETTSYLAWLRKQAPHAAVFIA
jgi:hypothetical protein